MVWCGGAGQSLAFDCFYICVGKIDLQQNEKVLVKTKRK